MFNRGEVKISRYIKRLWGYCEPNVKQFFSSEKAGFLRPLRIYLINIQFHTFLRRRRKDWRQKEWNGEGGRYGYDEMVKLRYSTTASRPNEWRQKEWNGKVAAVSASLVSQANLKRTKWKVQKNETSSLSQHE